MRGPGVRFTVRWLMILVLLAAAFLATFEAGRRWERQSRIQAQEAAFRGYYQALFRQQASAEGAEARAIATPRPRKVKPSQAK